MNRGQIIEKGSNKYLLRVYQGRVEGKRQYASKTVSGTRRDAERELTALLGTNDSGKLPLPSNVTVGDFLGRWLEARVDLREKTRADYESLIRLNVVPFLGHLRVRDLTTDHLQHLYSGSLLSDRKLSPRSIQYVHAVLRQALETAVDRKLIPSNPADRVNLPRAERREMQALSPEQTKAFLKATAGSRYGLLWRLLLTTGLRPSEALALQWRDLEGEWLSVRRTVAAEGVVDEGKTDGATRRISVPGSARVLLESSRGAPEAFIFGTSTGNHLDLSTVRKEWKKALASAGLPEVRLYDARHTHATHLIGAGVNVKALAHRLGHSNPTMLLKTYAHVLPEVEQESARIAERLLEAA